MLNFEIPTHFTTRFLLWILKKNMIIIEKISIDAVKIFWPNFFLVLVKYILNGIWRKILYRGYIKNAQILGGAPPNTDIRVFSTQILTNNTPPYTRDCSRDEYNSTGKMIDIKDHSLLFASWLPKIHKVRIWRKYGK